MSSHLSEKAENLPDSATTRSGNGDDRERGDDLLGVLEELFLSDGYRGVTLRALAARLGCSNRRLYALAPSKEELFLLVMTRFFERTKREGWTEAQADGPLVDRIRAYLRVGIVAAERAGPKFNEDIESLPAGRRLFDAFQQERIEGLRLLIEEGKAKGEFDGYHAMLVAEVMIQSSRRLREPDFLARSGMTFAEALTELSRLIRNGLARR